MQNHIMKNEGMTPSLSNAGSGAVHHHFFACPICGDEVGGFTITGDGEDDWDTHKDKFCRKCGQKIDWSDVEWSAIYRY